MSDLDDLARIQDQLEGGLAGVNVDDVIPDDDLDDLDAPPGSDDRDDADDDYADDEPPAVAPPSTWQVNSSGKGTATAVMRVPLKNGRTLVATGRGRRRGDALRDAAAMIGRAASNKAVRSLMPPQAVLAAAAITKVASLAKSETGRRVLGKVKSSALRTIASIFA